MPSIVNPKLDVKSLIFWLIFLSLTIIAHVFLPNIGGIIITQREYVIWIFIVVIILLSLLSSLKKGYVWESPLSLPVLLFVALLMVGILFNPIRNLDNFYLRTFKLIASVILWFSLIQIKPSKRDENYLLVLMFISSSIEGIIGLMQFFGLYRHIPITPASGPEIYGVFQQKNLFGSWIALGIALGLYILGTKRFDRYSSFKKTLFWASNFVLCVSLVLCGSRTGLIGASLAIVILLVGSRSLLPKKNHLKLWFLIVGGGLISGMALSSLKEKMPISKVYETKLEWLLDIKQPSFQLRLIWLKTSVQMFIEKPIFGQGFSNMPSLFMYFQGRLKEADPALELENSYTIHPHNEIAMIAAESGLLGLGGLLFLVVTVIKLYWPYRRRFLIYLSLLTPLLVHMMLEFPLDLSVSHYLVFILLWTITTSHFLKKVPIKLPKPSVALIGAVFSICCIVVVVFLVKTFVAYNQMVIWYIEKKEGKSPDYLNILGASENLYLRNWAVPMHMIGQVEEALKDSKKNESVLIRFAEWAHQEKYRQPIRIIFQMGAIALLELGKLNRQHVFFDEAMKMVEEGIFLYPSDDGLKALRNRIGAEAIKTLIVDPASGLEAGNSPLQTITS